MLSACRNDIPNPHKKCVQELLNCLACLDNDYQRVNIELRNIQKEFKQSVDNTIFQYSEMRKLVCASDEKINEFKRNVENIDSITESFNKRVDDIQKERQQIIDTSKIILNQLITEKLNFKKFYQNSINYLKSYAVERNDVETVRNCEKDLNEINKQFTKEINYFMKCESDLGPFLQLLYECKTPMCKYCSLNDFDWLPQGKSTDMVDTIAKEIRETMGNTLRKAFANLFIHNTKDRYGFLVQYLMNSERRDELIKEKLQMFTK